jgi:hypothetical protein
MFEYFTKEVQMLVGIRVKLGCAALIAMTLFHCRPTIAQTKPSGQAVFESEPYGFRLSYPASFRKMDVQQQGLGVMLMRATADKGGSNANVIVAVPENLQGTKDKPLELKAAYSTYLEMVKGGLKDANIIEEGDAKLAGEPAKFAVVEAHQQEANRPTKLKVIVATHGQRLYGVIAMSEPEGYETLAKDLQQIVDSFQWRKPAEGNK